MNAREKLKKTHIGVELMRGIAVGGNPKIRLDHFSIILDFYIVILQHDEKKQILSSDSIPRLLLGKACWLRAGGAY